MMTNAKNIYATAERIAPTFSAMLPGANYISDPALVRAAICEARRSDPTISSLNSDRSIEMVHQYLMGEIAPL